MSQDPVGVPEGGGLASSRRRQKSFTLKPIPLPHRHTRHRKGLEDGAPETIIWSRLFDEGKRLLSMY